MDNIKISLDASGANSEISVVRVDGVIDTMTASELERFMNSLLQQKRYNIIVDLGGVDYISSAGWGIFISNIREIRQNSGDIKLARMVPSVHEIFELLEFDSILRSFDNIEKARVDFEPANPSGSGGDGADKASVVSQLADAGPTVATAAPADISPDKSSVPTSVSRPPHAGAGSLEERVLEVVGEDPFMSISQIKKILNSDAGAEEKIGWWKVRSILKKNDILSKKKRFRYSRGG
jgi:anti-sigma B factor antagonist